MKTFFVFLVVVAQVAVAELKVEDYQNRAPSAKPSGGAQKLEKLESLDFGPDVSAEQKKQLLETLEKAKKFQEEHAKALKDLEKENP